MDIRRVDQQYNVPQRMDTQGPAPKEQTPPPPSESVSMGQTPTEEPKVPKKWTIMHYTAADNNLLPYMTQDVNEMERIGSTDKMNLISLLDRGGDDCKLYYITKDADMNKINSQVLENMGRTDTANPKVLTDFIVKTTEKFPAEHFALVLADHGAGWQGAISDDGSGGFMSMPTIRKAIEEAEEKTGKKIDVVGFDCCLMATGEVASELQGVTNFMVASQESEGGDGWPYTPLLTSKALRNIDRALRTRLDVTPQELAEKIVSNAATDQQSLPTMSAYDLGKTKLYEDATNKFAQAIIDSDTPNTVFKKLARQSQGFSMGNLKDHFHFAELITKSPEVTDANLKEAAKGLMDTIKNEFVIAEQHADSHPNAHGVTAEVPSYGGASKDYKELKFAENTLWDEAIDKYSKGKPGEEPPPEEGPGGFPGGGFPGFPGDFPFPDEFFMEPFFPPQGQPPQQ